MKQMGVSLGYFAVDDVEMAEVDIEMAKDRALSPTEATCWQPATMMLVKSRPDHRVLAVEPGREANPGRVGIRCRLMSVPKCPSTDPSRRRRD